MMGIVRVLLFNVLFYCATAVQCLILLPTLVLPREVFLSVVKFWVRFTYVLEKYVLGLQFEVRGAENLPESGPYIVAAKHMSAYETMKLHYLFDDPAIVLKQELYRIPLWGWFLKKADMIGINRKNREEAVASIVAGAQRMKDQGRVMVIFPQGTRVKPDATPQQKPYRPGVVKMAVATGLPIIPMALNSGLFWPRNAFFKRPGKVVFEFLPPITPEDGDEQVIKTLGEVIDVHSLRLMHESVREYPALAASVSLPEVPAS